MKTCPLLLVLATFTSCLTMTFGAEDDQDIRRYSLLHMEANTALRKAFESLAMLADVQEDGKPVPLDVTVGSTKLTSDPRTNSLTIVSTDAAHLEFIEEFLLSIDAKHVTVQVSAVLLEVGLDNEAKHAVDVLKLVDSVTIDGVKVNPKKISNDPDLNDEQREKAFAAYADALGALEQCEVLARPSIILRNGDEGTLRIGNDGQGNQVSVTPTTHPDKTIGLDIEWKDLTNEQSLESTVQVPNLAVTTLGGLIQEDDGTKKERLILLQAAIK